MAVKDWSTTAASNTAIISGMSLDGSIMTVSQTDNAFRDIAAQIASQLGKMGFEGADIASATTTNLANATGWSIDITGTTTITGLGTVDAGQVFILRFTGVLILTHNATSLILPGAANITTVAGDIAIMKSEGSGNWRCVSYQRSAGLPTVGPATTTDNTVPRFNGTAGALQTSGVTIDDSNVLSGGAWNGTVGATTPAAGTFTTLTANSATISSTTPTLTFTDTSTGADGLISADSTAGSLLIQADVNNEVASSGIAFSVDGTETARMSSTSHLVGIIEAFSPTSGSETGIYLQKDGNFGASASGQVVGLYRRLASDGTILNFYRQNTNVGSISVTASATAFNTSSDGNLKTNLRTFDSGAIIDAIEAWQFDWRAGGSGYGVIAQDAHKVFPDAISPPEGEGDHWKADYSKFVPLLLAEVKALRARVASLEA